MARADELLSDFELRKYHSAKRIWRDGSADELVPDDSDRTWSAWFRAMYHEDLNAYIQRARREKLRDRVEATHRARARE